MNCIDVQRLIMPFINDELSNGQLEEFIHHIRNCPNCMEELEVYYVLLAGMKQLDDDKELSNDFHQDFMDLIRLSEERIIHQKFLHIRKRIVLIILISLVAVASSLRLGEFVVEDVLNAGPKKSVYMTESLFIVEELGDLSEDSKNYGKENLSGIMLDNLPEIYAYLKQRDTEGAILMKEAFGDRIWDEYKAPRGIGRRYRIPNWITGVY
ncbi:hypothetical protein acsn021_27810 [Anaerocolumna cellulosilytica]|uniref:Uncharacterized protein n=1 Tax=Anaerocolumna cellulosilytica TaxID=433286 RepID=A0A6S6R710_9FIRM|nr:zf-HC2 domain-containing protein [Anaerocolumna cellulosilytica]MBB5196998.1 hypothetical protein [Anaerocolumna cellulosilytica]BCJ95212.1 hypothetical protein acsn021_27810 [Anaerocolumna cellulosilytica]